MRAILLPLLALTAFAYGQAIPAPSHVQIPQEICSYTVAFSPAVQAKDKPAYVLWVNSAVATWKSVAPTAARFRYEPEGPADLVIVIGPETLAKSKYVVGLCQQWLVPGARAGLINVITEWGHWWGESNPMSAQMVKSVTMHEIGHFLGLDHNHCGVMRMFDVNNLPLAPSRDEIAEVKKKA